MFIPAGSAVLWNVLVLVPGCVADSRDVSPVPSAWHIIHGDGLVRQRGGDLRGPAIRTVSKRGKYDGYRRAKAGSTTPRSPGSMGQRQRQQQQAPPPSPYQLASDEGVLWNSASPWCCRSQHRCLSGRLNRLLLGCASANRSRSGPLAVSLNSQVVLSTDDLEPALLSPVGTPAERGKQTDRPVNSCPSRRFVCVAMSSHLFLPIQYGTPSSLTPHPTTEMEWSLETSPEKSSKTYVPLYASNSSVTATVQAIGPLM